MSNAQWNVVDKAAVLALIDEQGGLRSILTEWSLDDLLDLSVSVCPLPDDRATKAGALVP